MNLLQGITVNLDPICILSVMALIVFFLYVMKQMMRPLTFFASSYLTLKYLDGPN